MSRIMSRRKTALLIAAALGVLCLSVVVWNRIAASQMVRVQFVCLTNVPAMGPQALLRITNHTPHEILADCVAYLGSGESREGLYPIPAGTGPWRASVRWQRDELSPFEERMSVLHGQLLDTLDGHHMHRGVWLPFSSRVSYSPDIQR